MPLPVPTSVPLIRALVTSIAAEAGAILAGLPADEPEEEPTTPPEPIVDETAEEYTARTGVVVTAPIPPTHRYTGSGWVPG